MEQSDTVQMQILQVEEIPTDINVQTIHVADEDLKAASSTEGGQDSPKACRPASESTLADDTDINVEVAAEDYLDASHIEVSVKDIDSDAGYNNQVESELNKSETKVYTSEQEQIKIYEHIKDGTIDSNHELQHLCTEEDQSQNVITESKVVEATQETIDTLESDCNVVGEANQSDSVDKQCLTLDESRLSEHSGGQIHDAHESVKETIREIHDNDSNQNSSIVTDAELTKLVQEETGVVVVVETIESATTDAAVDNFIVTLDEKDVNRECNQETIVTLQEKEITKSRHEDNEIDLIDYSQENDDTIIEVTEVIDAPITEQYEQQDKKDCAENNECHIESVKLTDERIEVHKDINDENIQSEAIDGETLISSSNKDDITIIIDEKIIITEDVDSEVTTDQSQIENTHEDIEDTTEHKQNNTPPREIPVVESSVKKRSVIQDIFDDWGVENTDEDAQSTSKVHDTVEIELKSLLDEAKSDQIVISEILPDKTPFSNKECATDEIHNVDTSEKNIKDSDQTENQKKNKEINQDAVPLNRSEKNSPASKSPQNVETRAFNKTSQSHIATSLPKNRSRHLTSQIASPAEVTEVLKERLREKQKTVVDTPRGPDIFFVKKLTQRLSNKLAGSSVNPVPGLIPLPQQTTPSSAPSQSTVDNYDKKITNAPAETSKDGNSDNKELLAILEGDVDPDWSILKPPTLTEEGKTPPNVESQSNHSAPPKLDPLVERELALKQLLELPVTSPKKISPRKKKTFRAAPGKMSKDVEIPLAAQEEKELVGMDSASENAQPNTKPIEINLCSPQKSNQKDHGIEKIVTREESRSGRKRKPTEKAREHEQNTIKRQKVYKGKVSLNKKQAQENISEENTTMENHVVASDALMDTVNNEKIVAKEVTSKQVEGKMDLISNKIESSRPKPSLARKGSQPIAKRKMVVKRLLRQKMPANEKSVRLKGKLTPSPKKSPPKTVSKSQKRTAESASSDVKPKKKIINEIDRLLQDEGVVNLLYDVEQPDKKRLVPITKSRAKVMDLQKVQRELKIRKKLVRNAVLRLRTSTVAGVTKVSPRSKRAAILTDVQADRKVGEQITSPKTATSPTEFILPAKIRNAADASIIIRRHSSSSFSSASGSPRVSVDAPEKPTEVAKTDDGAVHSLRSAKKRRDSQDEKIINAKKSKKKTVQKFDTESVTAVTTGTISTTTTTTTTTSNTIHNADEKVTVAARPNKKSEIKKIEKTGKQQENVHAFEDNVSSKVTTRSSNGAVTGKITAKSRRAMKSKVTFIRTGDPNNTENSSKEEDELSACLAEAATALSIVNAGGRSGNVTTTRKSKGKNFYISTIIFPFSLKNKNYNRFVYFFVKKYIQIYIIYIQNIIYNLMNYIIIHTIRYSSECK